MVLLVYRLLYPLHFLLSFFSFIFLFFCHFTTSFVYFYFIPPLYSFHYFNFRLLLNLQARVLGFLVLISPIIRPFICRFFSYFPPPPSFRSTLFFFHIFVFTVQFPIFFLCKCHILVSGINSETSVVYRTVRFSSAGLQGLGVRV